MKANKNFLAYENRLIQKEDRINSLERETSFFRGKDCYKDQSYLLFQPKSAYLLDQEQILAYGDQK